MFLSFLIEPWLIVLLIWVDLIRPLAFTTQPRSVIRGTHRTYWLSLDSCWRHPDCMSENWSEDIPQSKWWGCELGKNLRQQAHPEECVPKLQGRTSECKNTVDKNLKVEPPLEQGTQTSGSWQCFCEEYTILFE